MKRVKTEIFLAREDEPYVCDFDYFPAEKMVWNYGDGSGYPGAPKMADLVSCKHYGQEIIHMMSKLEREELETKFLEEYEEEPDYPETEEL